MAPDWEKLAADWAGHAVGMIAEVDCTEPSGQTLCEEYGVEGFPTLMYGDPNGPEVRFCFLLCCLRWKCNFCRLIFALSRLLVRRSNTKVPVTMMRLLRLPRNISRKCTAAFALWTLPAAMKRKL